ncbi:hypothetical protein [Azospirillum picis]|uniref:Phosphatase n=1 Tax=Azospirillum picis TaxID=488438 RepID=A0ABU0MD61_9PROT|nr:hypothetical protein [Azospirillum picis]MBP2297605.1 hypothetical protein [Azospirillum picis]MDQ0531372.1 hypothetical protein [Azospirillum picis]
MTGLRLSRLGKTWLIDIDGVLVRHNGHKQCGHKQGGDQLLPGVTEFFARLEPDDRVVLLSARSEAEREATLAALERFGLRWDHALFGLPTGERICINDRKPSGLTTSLAVNLDRDAGLGGIDVVIDPHL